MTTLKFGRVIWAKSWQMKMDVFLRIVYLVFTISLIVNLFFGTIIYFEFDVSGYERRFLVNTVLCFNGILFFLFLVYPIYGNIKHGMERKKIWKFALFWMSTVLILCFIIVNDFMSGIS